MIRVTIVAGTVAVLLGSLPASAASARADDLCVGVTATIVGDDVIRGLGGDDDTTGTDGRDTLHGTAGSDGMFGGKDDDTCRSPRHAAGCQR